MALTVLVVLVAEEVALVPQDKATQEALLLAEDMAEEGAVVLDQLA
jgi:hypothetical protein